MKLTNRAAMDIDHEEVVREPFEQEENSDEDNQFSNGNSSLCSLGTSTEHGKEDELSEDDSDKQDDSCSEASTTSTAFAEDQKFADLYGIKLQSSKGKRQQDRAYQRLLNSNHITEGQETSVKSENKTSNHITPQEPRISTSVTSDCIYHRGTFYQKGDIVAVRDQDDGLVYFAQLTGFLQDQYCEKSGSLNWLVPSRPTSREFFDPSAYRIGLDDRQLRKLDCMTFVRHCPHDYYLRKMYQLDNVDQTISCSSLRSKSNKGEAFIWTTMDPCEVPNLGTGLKNTKCD